MIELWMGLKLTMGGHEKVRVHLCGGIQQPKSGVWHSCLCPHAERGISQSV